MRHVRIVAVAVLCYSSSVGVANESGVPPTSSHCKESLRQLHGLFKRVVQTGDYTKLDGTWRAATPGVSEDWVTHANAVRVECRRTTGICTEYIALVNADRGTIETFVWPYTIRAWSTSMIRATAAPGAVDLELIISITRESATRTLRETAPPHPGRVERWTLQ
jgi:hypothetical protein